MGVALKLKDVSSCQHGVDKVGLRSGFQWFRVISSSYESSECCDLERVKYHGVVLGC